MAALDFPTATATGGTKTTSGGYTIHTFTTSGTFTVPSTLTVDILVVAGGGGGAARHAGGGGGGGVIVTSGTSLAANTYTVTVGSGGSGFPGDPGSYGNSGDGTTGNNSTITGTGFTSIIAYGGGGGAGAVSPHTDGTAANRAKDGGSGGGGNGYYLCLGGYALQPTGSNNGGGTGYGNAGGQSGGPYSGAGGGGAGAVGQSANGGNGGAGIANSYSGSSVYYAGGGGGGGYYSASSGSGGTGGGGAGATNGNGGGNGTANTGGGGGGDGGGSPLNGIGGGGGSGIVIIRYSGLGAGTTYTTSAATGSGGTLTTSSGNNIHTFTSSGSFTVSGGTISASVLIVGGGGAGGNNTGGGGAGGLLYGTISFPTGTYTATIGAGGASYNVAPNTSISGTGITTATALGGGGGGGGTWGTGDAASYSTGGSGGGNGYAQSSSTPSSGGSATQGNSGGLTGFGNAGGGGINGGNGSGGGGGGAGAAGQTSTNSNVSGGGGIGKQYNITGSNLYYAGGGGGAGYGSCAGGNGGLGGGAGGGSASGSRGTSDTSRGATSTSTGNGGTGGANTGGGGGGSAYGSYTGGAGGSGIIIISYPTPLASQTFTYNGSIWQRSASTSGLTGPTGPTGPGVNDMPRIESVAPSTATEGGTITLTGTNFSTSASLYLEGTQATSVTATSTSITATVPAIPSTGTYSAYVLNPDGGCAVKPLAFSLTALLDPYFNLTVLSLHGNGTNAATNNTFLDSSTNALSITRNGSATQGSFSPFSQTGWSNYFNGSSGFTFPNSSQFSFAGDFTWEAWLYFPSLPGTGAAVSIICSRGNAASDSAFQFLINNVSGSFLLTGTISIGSTDYNYSGSLPALSANTWYHFALVRSGTTVTGYMNGSSVGTLSGVSGTTNSPTTANPSVGYRSNYNDLYFTGYISNLRMVASAVYTSGFTPTTTPLTAITNTRILTCQSNRFVDNSTNALAITPTGTPSVQPFSPFAPGVLYSASTVGGSIYLDGSSYLNYGSSSVFSFGTSDFTVEAWFYMTSIGSSFNIFNVGGASAGSYSLYVYNSSGYKIQSARYGDAVGAGTTATIIALNTWYHVAAVRISGTMKVYINGAADSNATYSMGSITNTGATSGTIFGTTSTATGYISGLRVISSSGYYTTNFTPPTAPVAAITNTQLLVNGTNAGVYDSTARNDLVTAGSAQLSSTQSKFGGTSMYFNGTTDYITIPAQPYFIFGSTGDFTIELWLYMSGTQGSYVPVITNQTSLSSPSSNYNNLWGLNINSTTLYFYDSAGNVQMGTSLTASTWYHVAVVRYGSNLTMYVNGTSSGSISTNLAYTASNSIKIGGGYSTNDKFFAGYIDDIRITRYARYTANFTPPTSQNKDR